jgi:hypothetical protein
MSDPAHALPCPALPLPGGGALPYFILPPQSSTKKDLSSKYLSITKSYFDIISVRLED